VRGSSVLVVDRLRHAPIVVDARRGPSG
jgi:hypothetical protein